MNHWHKDRWAVWEKIYDMRKRNFGGKKLVSYFKMVSCKEILDFFRTMKSDFVHFFFMNPDHFVLFFIMFV
jgi:hypothetical protein